MDKHIRELLNQVESVPDFVGIQFKDINDTNSLGDNALHCVCVWGDIEAVKLLVEGGIDIEQRGEGGFTPLKVAQDFGHKEIMDYLIAQGTDISALNADFQFNHDDNARHMKRLRDGIENLETKIRSKCNKNA